MENQIKDLCIKGSKILESYITYYFPQVEGISDFFEKNVIEKGIIDNSINKFIKENSLGDGDLKFIIVKEIINSLITNEDIKINYEEHNDKSNDEDECCICMDHKANSQTSCGHWICFKCWEEVIKVKGKECPFCRQAVESIKVFY